LDGAPVDVGTQTLLESGFRRDDEVWYLISASLIVSGPAVSILQESALAVRPL
jgi:hypothetical protein